MEKLSPYRDLKSPLGRPFKAAKKGLSARGYFLQFLLVYGFFSGGAFWAWETYQKSGGQPSAEVTEVNGSQRAPASVQSLPVYGVLNVGILGGLGFGISQLMGFLGVWIFGRMKKLKLEIESAKTDAPSDLGSAIQDEKLIMLGELTASLAHELSSPLTSVKAYAQSIRQELKGNTNGFNLGANHLLDRVDFNLDRMMKIAKSLRGFVHGMGSENPALRGEETFSTRELLDEVTGLVGPSLKNNKINFEILDFQNPIYDLKISASKTHFSLVLMNLILNARDALIERESAGSKNQVGPIDARITLGLEKTSEGKLCMWVENNGPVIPKDKREKIFEPFYTTKGRGRGTGMGLSLSRALCEHANSELILDDRAGWTRFCIRNLSLKKSN